MKIQIMSEFLIITTDKETIRVGQQQDQQGEN
jgi:hypothetical protein